MKQNFCACGCGAEIPLIGSRGTRRKYHVGHRGSMVKAIITSVCATCGSEISDTKHRTFCSRGCAGVAAREKSRESTYLGFDAYDEEDRGYSTPCWIYRKKPTERGYAQIKVDDGRQTTAHRAFYEHYIAPIPEGLQLDHLCRVRRCVNPAHLEPVTPRENVLRGIGISAQNARKTHCVRGHAFDEENTAYTPGGARRCRACAREKARERLTGVVQEMWNAAA